ncbi:hypothetical protein D0N87_34470, partial [Pseudomonas sp. ATCC 13867]
CLLLGDLCQRFLLTPTLSLRERGQTVPAETEISSCAERSPLPLGDDCMDAGGRATQDAKAEAEGRPERRYIS